MQTQFHGKLVRRVHGLVEPALLPGGDVIDGKRRGLIARWRVADLPVDERGCHRPASGQLVLRVCAQGPSAVLIEGNVAEAIDGEGRRR